MIIQLVIIILSLILTFLFFLYGFNHYYLLRAAKNYHASPWKDASKERPSVAVHLPIFNEKYVIRRLLAACTSMAEAYGVDRVRIFILDDSNDDTVNEIDAVVGEYLQNHFQIEILRRGSRQGYKAGALQAALEKTTEEYIAIFDADFIPAKDFLVRTVPYFVSDERLGIVQSRWGHLNRDFNILTKGTAILMDIHFLIEQAGRYAKGIFQNFNGSGGVLRKKAILEAGGWQADTLAEDLDLSYCMQLLGYRILYLRDLETPGEIPPTFSSYKQQQTRWACGSLRVAKKILPVLLPRRDLGIRQRFQSFVHLTGYLIHTLMTLSFILVCVASFVSFNNSLAFQAYTFSLPHVIEGSTWFALVYYSGQLIWILLGTLIALCTLAPWISGLETLRLQKLSLVQNLTSLFFLFLLGFGTSLNNTLGAGRALLSDRIWEWTRTPKYADLPGGKGLRHKRYQVPLGRVWFLELAFAALGILAIRNAFLTSRFLALFILIPFSLSYAFVTLLTLIRF